MVDYKLLTTIVTAVIAIQTLWALRKIVLIIILEAVVRLGIDRDLD
jgi:hypothetical protein